MDRYVATAVGDGVAYLFPPGTLARTRWLTCDMLLDGQELAVFELAMQEGDGGRRFQLRFGLLANCQARVRVPLTVTDQNRWQIGREGAWLKPLCSGDAVDLSRLDRITLTLLRHGSSPVRWWMSRLEVRDAEPPRLEHPLLPQGQLVDELGQCAIRDWPGKTRSLEQMAQRLRDQLAAAPRHRWPARFTRWGGDAHRRLGEGTGFFRTHHDGRRWWLVDPDGHAFWSAGQDCIGLGADANVEGLEDALPFAIEPDANPIRYPWMKRNFARVFGSDGWQEAWKTIILGELRRTGFNTIGNWSQWRVASEAGFPYVRPLEFAPRRTARIFRDFPDVFDPAFAEDAEEFAQQLAESRDDPALIGYFLMNEPTWGFAHMTPAEGMLINAPDCATRRTFDRWLAERGITTPSEEDFRAFSTIMVQRFFGTLSDACRRVDPDHLNLGARYHTIPPDWALAGMESFEVFSFNCYRERIPTDQVAAVSQRLNRPVLIGEWHFGAMDVGLPATGIGAVATQADRGKAYRVYLETAAADPHCVGVHHFICYDQSCIGRFDGENYNIGFYDICHQPYEPLIAAARASHERMYDVAAGTAEPYTDAPQYLPRLFI